MKTKLIVTDLDKTLLKSNEIISDYTIDVFQRVRKLGILVAFATARSLEGSQEYRILIDPDADIVTGGCLIFIRNQLLHSYYMPEPQLSFLLTDLCANPLIKRISGRSLNASYSNIPIDGRICIDFKYPLPENLLHCSCRTDDIVFMKSITDRYLDFSILHISGSDLYDINPKDATKFNGIKIVAEYFNIPISEAVSFGDDFNDIDMLQKCGIGVAMNNAIDECKAVADFICDTNDNDGVAKWIEKHIL